MRRTAIFLLALTLTLALATPVEAVSYQVRGGIVSFGGASSADYTVTSSDASLAAPSVSSVATTDATESGVKITWTTDVSSDSFVEYGTTTSYGSSQGIFNSVTSHAVTLIGLQYATTYQYRVCSRRAGSSTRGCSSNNQFTTGAKGTGAKGAPSISSVGVVVDVGTVTVTWTTDTNADSFVDYGLTTTYTGGQGLIESKTSHKVILRGLVPGTIYHYRVRSTDSQARTGYDTDKTFSTASSAASGISGVEVVEVGLDFAVVTWSTGSVSTSAVHYGTTQVYDSVVKDESEAKTTQHTLRLTALTAGTRYHFQIRGTDASGEAFSSDDYIFETINLPKIENIKGEVDNAGKAYVSWTTNIPADSIVVYGPTTDYGLSTGSGDLTTDHRVTISGLDDDTVYHYKVTSRDALGNRAESEDLTFTTLKDEISPSISEILTESSSLGSGETAKVQLIVSWVTDEPATGQIEYGIGVSGETYENTTIEDSNLNASHLVIVSGLEPASAYHFRVVSKDKSGNVGKSADFTVVTPPQEESVLQLVIQSWEETFAWVPKLRELLSF